MYLLRSVGKANRLALCRSESDSTSAAVRATSGVTSSRVAAMSNVLAISGTSCANEIGEHAQPAPLNQQRCRDKRRAAADDLHRESCGERPIDGYEPQSSQNNDHHQRGARE